MCSLSDIMIFLNNSSATFQHVKYLRIYNTCLFKKSDKPIKAVLLGEVGQRPGKEGAWDGNMYVTSESC